jgi:hypothetical protein
MNYEDLKHLFGSIRGKMPVAKISIKGHCGNRGYEIEKAFGIAPNSRLEADLHGIEIKDASGGNFKRITCSDLFPTEKIGITKNPKHVPSADDLGVSRFTRLDFIKAFGMFNEKTNRLSWAGSAAPSKASNKTYTATGQKIVVDSDKNVRIIYNLNYDFRENKYEVLPPNIINGFLEGDVTIFFWPRAKFEKMFQKFCGDGVLLIYTSKRKGTYSHMILYKPLTKKILWKYFRKGLLFFDSGNHEFAKQWRFSFRMHPSCVKNAGILRVIV